MYTFHIYQHQGEGEKCLVQKPFVVCSVVTQIELVFAEGNSV